MSSNANDCSAIAERINEHKLSISTTEDQLNKLEPDDPDIQNMGCDCLFTMPFEQRAA